MTSFIPDAGLASIAQTVIDADSLYLAIGSGDGQTVTDTDLDNDTGETRVQATLTAVTTTTTNDSVQAVAELTMTAAALVTEVALFDAATGGNMVYYEDGLNAGEGYQVFADDVMTFTIKVLGGQY